MQQCESQDGGSVAGDSKRHFTKKVLLDKMDEEIKSFNYTVASVEVKYASADGSSTAPDEDRDTEV